MKIKKYKKEKGNIYKIYTDKEEYKLYDDIIIKYELLLKNEIDEKKFADVLKENNRLKAYYDAIKSINARLRTSKELKDILGKKGYKEEEINYSIKRLETDGYLNHSIYIESYIHDRLALYLEGENKIKKDLIKLGFKETEILPYLNKIDEDVYAAKIKKYIDKKAKSNKKSIIEFKKRTTQELINKGFSKEMIISYLESVELEENEEEIKKLVNKLYSKYSKKFDDSTTIYKIKNALYQKGYYNIDVEKYI